ncbi:MAG TPA: site-2 protease family protein [Anaerolineales bacterium]|nr:site-2 protease family protein [Anaerolineales bacterium]
MGTGSIRLGKIFGIPIAVDYSWFLVLILFTWTFAISYYPSEFKNWTTAQYWVVGAITALTLFASVLLHELGHSLIALRYKIPVRNITLFIFGGISQISEEPVSALSEFWITIAGPIVSFVLAGIFALLTFVTSGFAPLFAIVKYLAYINLILGIFNLIPGFPLDGGGVLMSIIWAITHNRHRALLIASGVGSVIAYLFIIFGVFQLFTGNLSNGLWIAFIGWFLVTASQGQIRQEKIKTILSGHKASEVMSQGYTIVQSETTLQALMDDHILAGSRRSFIVEKGDEVVGLLTLHHLQNTPKDQWATTTVAQVMIPCSQWKEIGLDTELWDAMAEMDRGGVNQLPVMAGARIEGMLTREDIISYLRELREPGK